MLVRWNDMILRNYMDIFDVIDPDREEEEIPHPPYPLIGVEWEVQISLPDFKKCRVNVLPHCDREKTKLLMDKRGWRIELSAALSKHVDVVSQNLEFKTDPAHLNELQSKCLAATDELTAVLTEIAAGLRTRIGVFLPESFDRKRINIKNGSPLQTVGGVTKHVNISFPYMRTPTSHFKLYAEQSVFPRLVFNNGTGPVLLGVIKPRWAGARTHKTIHWFVPTDFRNYSELLGISEALVLNPDKVSVKAVNDVIMYGHKRRGRPILICCVPGRDRIRNLF